MPPQTTEQIGRAGRPRKSAAPTGITVRHGRACNTHSGGFCNCKPTYRAFVYSKADGKKIRRSFSTLAAAKGWRVDAMKAVKDKKMRAPTTRTLRQEVEGWLSGAKEGTIRKRSGEPYKPAVLRLYESSLRLRVLPELGERRLGAIDRTDLLTLKESLYGAGCSDSQIRNALVPLQAIMRRAWSRGDIPTLPTLDLGLPTPASRNRAATPAQAAELLSVIPEPERALWATAFYAGLRRGELRGLRVHDIDVLGGATISVERGWDQKEGAIAPKSRAGTRKVFVLDVLKPYLEPLANGEPHALVFGSGASPFEPRNVERKARGAVQAENEDRARAELPPVEWFGLHEARHSFSTFMDHAGVSESRADRYMGHSAPGVAGRYRHLLPGQIAEDARRVDEYLSGSVAGKVVELSRAGSAA